MNLAFDQLVGDGGVLAESGLRHRHHAREPGERDQCTAKFWLDPVQLAGSRGFRSHELNRIRALVIEHRVAFKEAWHGHFGTEA